MSEEYGYEVEKQRSPQGGDWHLEIKEYHQSQHQDPQPITTRPAGIISCGYDKAGRSASLATFKGREALRRAPNR